MYLRQTDESLHFPCKPFKWHSPVFTSVNASYLYSWDWPICSLEDTFDQNAMKLQISETFTLLHVNFCVYAYTDMVFLLH